MLYVCSHLQFLFLKVKVLLNNVALPQKQENYERNMGVGLERRLTMLWYEGEMENMQGDSNLELGRAIHEEI